MVCIVIVGEHRGHRWCGVLHQVDRFAGKQVWSVHQADACSWYSPSRPWHSASSWVGHCSLATSPMRVGFSSHLYHDASLVLLKVQIISLPSAEYWPLTIALVTPELCLGINDEFHRTVKYMLLAVTGG